MRMCIDSVLHAQTCSATLSHHSDKVQSVQWHALEPAVLASAAYDQKLAVLDVRSPAAAAMIALGSDPEVSASQ